MLIDTALVQQGQTLHADICVVGAGPAGISLVRELAGGGLDVCVLEAGGPFDDAATRSLTRGENAGHAYYPLHRSRGRSFGGSSNLWFHREGVHTRPLDPEDLEPRSWIPESGWPVDFETLSPHLNRAHALFGLPDYDYDVDRWQRQLATPALNLNPQRVRTSMFNAGQEGTFADHYIELVKDPHVQLALHATVLELEASADSPRVERARVRARHSGTFYVSCKAFVLAAGGIENARLLLLSNSRYREGLGNQNDLVGRFFMEHLHVNTSYIEVLRPGTDLRLYSRQAVGNTGTGMLGGLVVAPAAQAEAGIGGFCALLHWTPVTSVTRGMRSARHFMHATKRRLFSHNVLQHARTVAGNLQDVVQAAYLHATGRAVGWVPELMVMSEQMPNAASRVTLTRDLDELGQRRVRLDWKVTDSDLRTIRAGEEILDTELRRIGVARLRSKLSEQDPLPTIGGGWHHMGTTRMSDDPRHGVVDRNGKVHGIANLFVTGTSVFPTGGYANPTLTAVALASRLANHLQHLFGYGE